MFICIKEELLSLLGGQMTTFLRSMNNAHLSTTVVTDIYKKADMNYMSQFKQTMWCAGALGSVSTGTLVGN